MITLNWYLKKPSGRYKKISVPLIKIEFQESGILMIATGYSTKRDYLFLTKHHAEIIYAR